jgi:predicted SPOUT superfamily RNA methylase MTH1
MFPNKVPLNRDFPSPEPQVYLFIYVCLHLIARKYKMTISSTKTKSMAMWGNHIQRVKIVINDNIIEQVTDFKYLGYRISEFKSDLEDKLQTYNKINGVIRRHYLKSNSCTF